MKQIILLLLFSLTLSFNCYSQFKLKKEIKNVDTNQDVMSKNIYQIDPDGDNIYEDIELNEDQSPEPMQGRDQFIKDFYRLIRYPPSARENGIEGKVLLEIEVDINGKIISTIIKKGLSSDCDKTALDAFIISTKNGFKPFFINNIPTKFKYVYPVSFSLN